MEPVAHPLLQQLTLQPAADDQLLWHCPLSQEHVMQLVPSLLAQLDCQLGALQQGADRLFWSVTFEEVALQLHFEGLCDSLWLQGPSAEIHFLRGLAAKVTQ
ncbi:DUF3630 family protein [uncultured Ferrimonas sp.]|uniref:DUF3630 family protein n=1 Tax=uncultured Ferrimonas sp. TaxID=432640 RepID=UPI0026072C21|nr:DUF3630 family protein [uncultured Ferrimonas sp.]